MIGAIIGDMVGAPYEFDRGNKTKEFPLFSRGSQFTDDSVMIIAVAEATASAIFLARNGSSKEEIKEYIISEFGYDLSRTCDEIRPGYHHVETCQQTVSEAITAFMEGTDFEDVIRTAVPLGGDCDTLTCIAGGMADARRRPSHLPGLWRRGWELHIPCSKEQGWKSYGMWLLFRMRNIRKDSQAKLSPIS